MVSKLLFQHSAARRRLLPAVETVIAGKSFNTQPPEGGWVVSAVAAAAVVVSTLSRPKAAGFALMSVATSSSVSTLSRPKAADVERYNGNGKNRFNTQPPEGGCFFFAQTK